MRFDNVLTKKFNMLSLEQKFEYMEMIDWIGNRSVSKSSMPMPNAYRTAEDWKNVLVESGFKLIDFKWIGFPKPLFHQGPYSLFVLSK